MTFKHYLEAWLYCRQNKIPFNVVKRGLWEYQLVFAEV